LQPNEITRVLNQTVTRERLAALLTRLAYTPRTGTHRTVTIAVTGTASRSFCDTSKERPRRSYRACSKNTTVAP